MQTEIATAFYLGAHVLFQHHKSKLIGLLGQLRDDGSSDQWGKAEDTLGRVDALVGEIKDIIRLYQAAKLDFAGLTLSKDETSEVAGLWLRAQPDQLEINAAMVDGEMVARRETD